MGETTLPKPRVADPIIFRSTKDAPERIVRPCTWKHREYWLAGYMVASCDKARHARSREGRDLGPVLG